MIPLSLFKPVSRKRVRKAKKPKPKRKPPPPPSTADDGDEKDSPSEEQIVGCPNRNQFCYICGFFTPPNNARNLTKNLITAYEEYFLVAYVPNMGFVPDLACDYCYRCLMGWKNGSERHKMKYVRPVTWKPQNEHIVEQCYFCLTKTTGFRYSTREKISYPNVIMFTKAQIRSEQYPTANSEEVARTEQTLTVAEEITTTETIRETTNVDKISPIEKGLAPSIEEIGVDTEENPLVDKIKTIESSVMTTSKEETPIIEDVTPS